MNTLVGRDFKVPSDYVMGQCRLKKLTVDEVEKDYKAVMSSKESLRQIFPFDDQWPTDDMTLEENYKDLVIHQEEFDQREAFAYTVVNLDDTECMGCLYIYSWETDLYDAQVYFWITDVHSDAREKGFFDDLRRWLSEYWGFKNIVFPGRDMPMYEWEDFVRSHSKMED